MPQINKKIHFNTSKLWTLIHKRDVTLEISDDFFNLICDGVNINLQNTNDKNNTALHYAVIKNDRKCVEFLLKQRPDLDISNDDKEKPEDLAKRLCVEDILRLLRRCHSKIKHVEEKTSKSSSVKKYKKKPHSLFKINLDYVKTFDFNNDSVESLQLDRTLRVLRITTDYGITTNVFQRLKSNQWQHFLEKPSHLFVIIIELRFNDLMTGLEEELSKIFKSSRPMIIHIKESNGKKLSTIFYKKNKSDELQKLVNLKELVPNQQFRSKIFEDFDGNLLNLTIDAEKFIEATPKLSVLCLRFLQMFLPLSNFPHEFTSTSGLLKCNDLDMFMTLLDLPFLTPKDYPTDLHQYQYEMINKRKGKDENILIMQSIESNNTEILKFLLSHNIDLYCNPSYAKIAMDKKYFDCLFYLLLYDSPFPPNYEFIKISQSNADNLKGLLNERRSFFKAIEQGSLEEVKIFINKYSWMRIIFNEDNKSAVMAALEAKKFKIYTMLIAQGFSPNSNENAESILSKLSKEEKVDLSYENKNNFTSFENSHIIHLISKSKLAVNTKNRETCFNVIMEMYEEINKVPDGKLTLQFVGQIDKLQIVFDFNQSFIHKLEPLEGEGVVGIAFVNAGYILIGAKGHKSGKKFSEIIGTICHEMMHLTLKLVYENKSNPFTSNNDKTKKKLNKIINDLHNFYKKDEFKRLDEIIRRVFENYNEQSWPAEIIVRVTELRVIYRNNNDKLQKLLELPCVRALFDFYDEYTRTAIESKIGVIKTDVQVREINNLGGLVSRLINSNIKIDNDKIDKLKDIIHKKNCISIFSNSPQLTLMNIYQLICKNYSDYHGIFLRLKSLRSVEFLDKIHAALNSNCDLFLLVDCSKAKLSDENINEIKKKLKTLKNITFVMDQEIELKDVELKKFTHDWNDLEDKSIAAAMSREFEFQGHNVIFQSIMDESIAKNIQLDFFLYKPVKIGQSLEIKELNYSENSYIERKFKFQALITGNDVKIKLNETDLTDLNEPLKLASIIMTNDESTFSPIKCSSTHICTAHKCRTAPIGKEYKPDQNTSSNQISLDTEKFIELALKHKKILISGSAGVGKSITLYHIALVFKRKHPTKWVEFIELKKYVKHYEKFKNSTEKFCDFLCETVFSSSKKFNVELFLHMYSKGETVLLLDGFDEISPNFKELFLKQLKTFNSKLKNILIITTRSHLQGDLELILDRFACTIVPLSTEDQVKMFTIYRKTDKNALEEQTIMKIIENFSSSESSKDENNIVGIPLLIRMIAETYNNDKDIDSTELFLFFKNYFENMIAICMNHKGEIANKEVLETAQKREQSIEFVHRMIALRYFFESEMPGIFSYNKVEWSDEEISRFGFVTISKGNPRFIHETVAEFFIADFLFHSDELSKFCHNTSKIVTKIKMLCYQPPSYRVLYSVLRDERFKVVRKFLESNLDKSEMLHKFLVEHFKPLDDERILMNSLEENNEALVTTFFTKIISNIWVSKKNSKNVRQISKINQKLGMNVLHYAVRNNSMKIITTIFGYFCSFKKPSNEGELKMSLKHVGNNGENILHCAARNDRIDERVFETVLKYLKTHLSDDEITEIMMQKNQNRFKGQNPLHLLLRKNGQNPFHIFLINNENLKCLEEFLDSLSNNLEEKSIRKLLMESDEHGSNCLSLVAECNEPKCIDSFWKFSGKMLRKDELKNYVQQINNYGNNVIQRSACFGSAENLSTVLKVVKNTLDRDELNIFLKHANYDGENVLHKVVKNDRDKNEGVSNTVFNHLKEHLNDEEIKELLMHEDNDGHNPLHVLLKRNKNIKFLKEFLENLKKNVNENDIRQLLMESDKFNCLTLIVNCKGSEYKDTFWNFSAEILTEDEFKQLMQKHNEAQLEK